LLTGRLFTTKLQVKNDTLSDLELLNVEEFVISNSDVPYDSSYVAKKDLLLMLINYLI
jgi:peptidyl-prolyl cis-trans isomerase D